MIKSEKLYIIGNGFDIHHGLACSFADFRLWLKENRPELYSQYKRIYSEVESATNSSMYSRNLLQR